MKPLTVEIHGTGTHNRGAELMALAIAAELRSRYPDVRIVVPPQLWDFTARTQHGFFLTWEFVGRLASIRSKVVRLAASRFPRTWGMVDPSNVDVVIDASGFAFSDQWGAKAGHILLRKMNQREREHQILIMMPQAFGPFRNPEVVDVCRKLFNRARLICARDTSSFQELQQLKLEAEVDLFPDFTGDLPPLPRLDIEIPIKFAPIVPNVRMLDKTDQADKYLQFLKVAIAELENSGFVPAFLLHDAKGDFGVIRELGAGYEKMPIYTHSHPQVLKYLLSKATVVVGSRFHALVSSLSQGVPCIGAGWSHKYPELFRQYACEEMLIQNLDKQEELKKAVAVICDPDKLNQLVVRIKTQSSNVKSETGAMWEKLAKIINNSMQSL